MTQKLGLNKGKRSSRSKCRPPLNLNPPCTLASTPSSQTVTTRSNRIRFTVMFNPHQNLDCNKLLSIKLQNKKVKGSSL
ncbi:hypothetical protein P8452_32278 [Trifolium repens]|nr:hypothetical protein P8452_32278 [Trifolium repens]